MVFAGEDFMTVILRARADITLDAFYRVAWRGEEVRFDAEALARMTACREAFLGLLESDDSLVIYGVRTRAGTNESLGRS